MASGVRTLGALLLGLVTGFWSLVVVFSDFLFLESAYVPAVAATLFVPSLIAGMLAPRRFYVSLLGAWGAVMFGLLGLGSRLSGGQGPAWSFVLFDLVAIPAIVLPGGWAGRHLDGPASRPTRGLTRPGADQNL